MAVLDYVEELDANTRILIEKGYIANNRNQISTYLSDGNGSMGMVVAQLLYWFLPKGKTGKPRVSHVYKGHLYLVKTYEELAAETFINKATVIRTVKMLCDKGMAEKTKAKSNFKVHEGNTVMHFRFVWEALSKEVIKCLESIGKYIDTEIADCTNDTDQDSNLHTPHPTKIYIEKNYTPAMPAGKVFFPMSLTTLQDKEAAKDQSILHPVEERIAQVCGANKLTKGQREKIRKCHSRWESSGEIIDFPSIMELWDAEPYFSAYIDKIVAFYKTSTQGARISRSDLIDKVSNGIVNPGFHGWEMFKSKASGDRSIQPTRSGKTELVDTTGVKDTVF